LITILSWAYLVGQTTSHQFAELNILYFSILLHSFNTKYLFFCRSM
jgi:hypothetical protein